MRAAQQEKNCVTEIEVNKISFKCDQYKFSSEKEITFHKHKNNKQWKHKCDEFELTFKNF